MKGILLLNGTPFTGKINADDAYVVCCDGAYEWARSKVRIDENVGDFDSLGYMPHPTPTRIMPAEKDLTDGEIGIRRLIERGIKNIEIYGGDGGRIDHFLGNLHLLYYANERKVKAMLINENTLVFVGSGKVELRSFTGKTISLLPFGKSLHINGSTGLKYPEPPAISYGQCVGISNVVMDDRASVTIERGCHALIVINRGRV